MTWVSKIIYRTESRELWIFSFREYRAEIPARFRSNATEEQTLKGRRCWDWQTQMEENTNCPSSSWQCRERRLALWGGKWVSRPVAPAYFHNHISSHWTPLPSRKHAVFKMCVSRCCTSLDLSHRRGFHQSSLLQGAITVMYFLR